MKCSESKYSETYDINKNSKYETSRKTADGNGADTRGCTDGRTDGHDEASTHNQFANTPENDMWSY